MNEPQLNVKKVCVVYGAVKMSHDLPNKLSDAEYSTSKAKYFSLIAANKILERFDRNYYGNVVKVLSEVNEKPTSEQAEYGQKYELIRDGEETYLIKKRLMPSCPIQRCVPVEDTFDILYEIHIANNHVSENRMRWLVHDTYSIRHLYIVYFLESCPVCVRKKALRSRLGSKDTLPLEQNVPPLAPLQKKTPLPQEPKTRITVQGNAAKRTLGGKKTAKAKKKTGKQMKERKVLLDVINFQTQADGDFKYILFYCDMATSFVLLRPLLLECPFDIASEIIKIVTSFGPPDIFVINPKYEVFYKIVVEKLQSLGLGKTISLIFHQNGTINTDYIQNCIYDWMHETETGNWAMGCHVVQWRLNNNKVDQSVLQGRRHNLCVNPSVSPHLYVFGKGPKSFCTPEPKSDNDSEFEVICELTDAKITNSNEEGTSARPKKPEAKKAEFGKNLGKKSTTAYRKTITITGDKEKSEDDSNSDCDDTVIKSDSNTTDDEEYVVSDNSLPFEDSNSEGAGSSLITVNNKEAVKRKSNSNVQETTSVICHICNSKVSEAYTCVTCQKYVHLFCSEMTEKPASIDYRCLNCSDELRSLDNNL